MHFKTNHNLSLRTFMEGFSFQKWKYLPPYIPHCRARSQYPPYSFSCLVSQVRSWLLSKDSAFPSHKRFLQAKESPNPLSWLGTAIVGPRLGSAQDQASGRRTGRSCLVGLHGCSQVLTKHNPTGHHHCRNYHEHCLEMLPYLFWASVSGLAPILVYSLLVWTTVG